MSEIKTTHLIISGKVQNVAYRAWMVSKAREYGVNGWVRNRSDGTVEATIQGEKSKVDSLIHEAYEGPEMAKVAEIVASESEIADVPEGYFEQWPTV